jgi:hypothetical protein
VVLTALQREHFQKRSALGAKGVGRCTLADIVAQPAHGRSVRGGATNRGKKSRFSLGNAIFSQ